MRFHYATPSHNRNGSDTVQFLSCSGGAFRGGVQFWVLVYLLQNYWFRAIHGVSVGAINGSMAASLKLDVLHRFWLNVDGLHGFFRYRWAYMIGFPLVVLLRDVMGFRRSWLLGGILDPAPLHEKLKLHCKLEEVQIPFSAGVVAANSGRYYALSTQKMKGDDRFALAVLSSAIMAPIMRPTRIQLEDGGEREVGFDGGYRNIFPVPWCEIARARAGGHRVVVHCVGCMPRSRVERIPSADVFSEWSMMFRAVEFFEAEIYETDFLELRKAVGPEGEVHLWLPQEHPGASFDASKKTIRRRLEIGKQTVQNGPVVLKGIG